MGNSFAANDGEEIYPNTVIKDLIQIDDIPNIPTEPNAEMKQKDPNLSGMYKSERQEWEKEFEEKANEVKILSELVKKYIDLKEKIKANADDIKKNSELLDFLAKIENIDDLNSPPLNDMWKTVDYFATSLKADMKEKSILKNKIMEHFIKGSATTIRPEDEETLYESALDITAGFPNNAGLNGPRGSSGGHRSSGKVGAQVNVGPNGQEDQQGKTEFNGNPTENVPTVDGGNPGSATPNKPKDIPIKKGSVTPK